MSERERKDAMSLLLIAGVVLSLVVINKGSVWLDAVAAGLVSVRPIAVTLVVALVSFALIVLTARAFLTRRALRDRARLCLVPSPSFDPTENAVSRFASGLGRSRRSARDLFVARALAVRVQLDTDGEGRLRYSVELPHRAKGAFKSALAAYGTGIELRELPTDASPALAVREGVEVARAELVLARDSSEPLFEVGLEPDPLAAFAQALSEFEPEWGDDARICVDLLPVSAGRRRRLRRRLLRKARSDHTSFESGQGDSVLDLLAGPSRRRRHGPAAPGELVLGRSQRRALSDKLGSPESLFQVQVLVRVASPVPGRAKAGITSVLGAFDMFAGENHWRVSGLSVFGLGFLGSDLPVRRRGFDERLTTGRFAPARRSLVTATEIAGFLKPPTAQCQMSKVVRSVGAAAPPDRLPVFGGQPDLLPLGRVDSEAGTRLVGVLLKDTFFSYMAGRSRWGKTETAIGQFLHLARAGKGCFFLDPHEDAIEKIKGYLTTEGLRERVFEINLADASKQPGWNLLATAGRTEAQAQGQVDAVVDAFASTLGWDERNTRALNLTTQATQALIELSSKLPAELAPTLFQIPTLLSDEQWRDAVLPHLSVSTRQFFTDRFPKLSEEAITPVTNLIDRLRISPPVAALLGNPVSSYNIRKAMDAGRIVLACPGSGSMRDRLIANFLVYDLLHAAKSRVEIPPDQRQPFYAFLDEVQTYDGAASGNLAALLEQAAKYGIRALLFNQNPERLTAATLNAVTTNRSHLITTALNAKAAGLIAREWAGVIEPGQITQLDRYTSLASVTLNGAPSPPFLVHGVPVEELFPDKHRLEDLPALEAAIDQAGARRPVKEMVAGLSGHDAAILDHLRGQATGGGEGQGFGRFDWEPPR